MRPAVSQAASNPRFSDLKRVLFKGRGGVGGLSVWKNTKLKIIVESAAMVTTSLKEMRPNRCALFYPVLWSVGAICG